MVPLCVHQGENALLPFALLKMKHTGLPACLLVNLLILKVTDSVRSLYKLQALVTINSLIILTLTPMCMKHLGGIQTHDLCIARADILPLNHRDCPMARGSSNSTC